MVVLPISKHMSGTYNSALMAKEQFPDAKIYVVDTLNTSFGLGLLVDMAVRFRDQGMGAKEIAERIDSIKEKVRLYAVIGDLKYLKMGGRLSSAGAAVGTLLGIKPIVCIRDGKVIGIDKARGMKAGYQTVLSYAEKDGIDTDYPVYFGHSDFPTGWRSFGRCIMKGSASGKSTPPKSARLSAPMPARAARELLLWQNKY